VRIHAHRQLGDTPHTLHPLLHDAFHDLPVECSDLSPLILPRPDWLAMGIHPARNSTLVVSHEAQAACNAPQESRQEGKTKVRRRLAPFGIARFGDDDFFLPKMCGKNDNLEVSCMEATSEEIVRLVEADQEL
jgi:hypothetical protein